MQKSGLVGKAPWKHWWACGFAIMILLTSSFFGSVAAVGVRPLEFTLNLRPGDSSSFQITLNPGSRQQNTQIFFALPTQNRSGGVSYRVVGPGDDGAHHWLQLPGDSVTVAPGEDSQVQIGVSVPYDAVGTHVVAVMVRPEFQENPGFVLQYAIHVNLQIDRPGLRPAVAVQEFDLVANPVGQPELQVTLTNESPLLFPVAAEAVIRDESRRIVERVRMYTLEGASDNRDRIRLFPNSILDYRGQVSKHLDPGKYEVRLFVNFADGRQTIQTLNVELSGDEFPGQIGRPPFTVDPENLAVEMNAGGAASQILQIANASRSEDVTVHIGFRDIENHYERSVFSALNIDLRGNETTTIGGDRQERVVATIRSDRSVAPGGYYGIIDIVEVPTEEKTPYWISLPIQVVVGRDWNAEATIEGVAPFLDEADGIALSVLLHNVGDIHLRPTARIQVFDQDNLIVETLTARPDSDDSILPARTGRLISNAVSFPPGEYRCEVALSEEGSVIAEGVFDIIIE